MTEVSEKELDVVKGNFLFGILSRDELQKITQERCQTMEFKKGDWMSLWFPGFRSLNLMLKGQARVDKGDYQVSILGPGEFYGATGIFREGYSQVVSITARTDCKVLSFGEDVVVDLMALHPDMATAYIQYLTGRILFLQTKLDELLAGSAEEKLRQYVREHYTCENEDERWDPLFEPSYVVELDCSVSELASRLHVSRAALYRAFDAFTADGSIKKSGKTIYILKENFLRWN